MSSRQLLKKTTCWEVDDSIPEATVLLLQAAAERLNGWLGGPDLSFTRPFFLLINRLWEVNWKPSQYLWQKLGYHHVEGTTIFIEPFALTMDTAIHEFAHVLDNGLGSHQLASIFGGGPSDDMARYLGYEPDRFFPRFHAPHFEQVLMSSGMEVNPTEYGRTYGPAEDFAESFRLAVTDPDRLTREAPMRSTWFQKWKSVLASKLKE